MVFQKHCTQIFVFLTLLTACADVSGSDVFFSRKIPPVTDAGVKPLLELVGHVSNFTESLIGERAFSILINNLDALTESLPSPYREEMAGIAEASGLKPSEVTLYNIFYEIFTFCTSIVAQDQEGRIFHGRNLDFGLFLGWNSSSHQWRVTQLLKPLILQVDWHRANNTVYSSVHYLGYVGIVTAVKKGAFSFSVNERFSWNGGYIGILEWILLNDHKQQWQAFLSRDLMESATTYEQAKNMLMKPRLLAPVYFILAGTAPGQGCIITRYRDDYKVLDLGSPDYAANWFLVQTNYDPWDTPPIYDDRRTSAISCLLSANRSADVTGTRGANDGQFGLNSDRKRHDDSAELEGMNDLVPMFDVDDVSNKLKEKVNVGSPSGNDQSNGILSLLFNVLSTRPVLNKLTTYTTLMSAGDGSIVSWLRDCPDPCWPW